MYVSYGYSSNSNSSYNQYCDDSDVSYCGIAKNVSQVLVKGYKFGEFKDSHSWVECSAKSHPGKKYFFNVRTKCKTWVRPVPDDVPLQHFNHQSRLYESNPDLDEPSMIMSDVEQETNNRSVGKRTSFDIELQAQDVLRKLYHGIELPDSDSGYTDDELDTSFNLPILQRKLLEPVENTFTERSETKGRNEVTDEASEKYTEHCLSITDFLEVKLNDSTQPLKIESLKRHSCETSSSEFDEDFDPIQQIFPPRLHKIRDTDLIPKTKRKYTKSKKITDPEKARKIQPTIRNMYGTTTINYNSDYECQLDKWPSHARVSNLSDTSVGTTWPRNNRTEGRLDKYFNRYRRPPSEMAEIRLSESSSSSSSSSDCSCCSSDSESSSTTSSSSTSHTDSTL